MDERKTIPQRMDEMVMWTGIPQLSARPPRRRPLPWVSALTAAGALAGFVVSAAAGFDGRAAWLGYGLLKASFIAGTLLQVFGPLKPFAGTAERVDEFDRALRARAYLFAFWWFALATAAGLLAVMYLMVMGAPRPAVIQALADLMLGLATVGFALPTAYASWCVEWHRDEG